MGNIFLGGANQPIQLYSLEEKLIWIKQVTTGNHFIDIRSLAKGVYLLQAGTQTEKIVIE